MNRYAEIGSPWRAPFFRLKYFVVKQLFSTSDSCFYHNILIQSIKILPKFNFFLRKTGTTKLWTSASKAFPKCIFTRKLFIFKWFVILRIISEINLPLSPVNCFSIEAVCSEDIIEGSTVFSLEANAFEIIFKSILNL